MASHARRTSVPAIPSLPEVGLGKMVLAPALSSQSRCGAPARRPDPPGACWPRRR
jgi:hypothetical protein